MTRAADSATQSVAAAAAAGSESAAAAAAREAEAAARETEAAVAAKARDLAAQQQAEYELALAESNEFWRAVEFASTLTDNGCENMGDSVGRAAARETWTKFSAYQASKERDAAIRALEKCRAAEFKADTATAAATIRDARKAFGIAIEDAYDEANPYSRGDLVATVSGSQLTISMSGGFGGRTRHTEAELIAWCDMDAAIFFSKITLRSKAHGTFTCEPYSWPGSEKVVTEALVDENLLGSWGTKAGDKPVPQRAEDIPKPTQGADGTTTGENAPGVTAD
jgi:hypothetical protein